MHRVKPRHKNSGPSVVVWILALLTCAAIISVFVVIILWMGLDEVKDTKEDDKFYSVPNYETDAKVSLSGKRNILLDTRDVKERKETEIQNSSDANEALQERGGPKVKYSIPQIPTKKDDNTRQTTTRIPETFKTHKPSTTASATASPTTTEFPTPTISTRNTLAPNYDDAWKAVTNVNPLLSTKNSYPDYPHPFLGTRYQPIAGDPLHDVQLTNSESKIVRSPFVPTGGQYVNSPTRRIDDTFIKRVNQLQAEQQTVRNPIIPLTESELSDAHRETNYYIYPEGGPEKYDDEEPDIAENPAASFLFRKIQELYKWISTDKSIFGIRNSTTNGTKLHREFKEVLQALNSSIIHGDSSTLLKKLKQLYYHSNYTKLNVTHPYVLNNTNSLVSFGLLAFDILLLHNVQLMAWEDEKIAKVKMLRDPEIFALNSLFLSPEKVRRMQDSPMAKKDILDESENNKTLLEEIFDFVNSALRAVLNLGKVYRRSAEPRTSGTVTPLDCAWTLYCRNLEKTSRLRGPYGFISRINSFGLRLVMGEFQVEEALEILIEEFSSGWNAIDCERLFPRCGIEIATAVVMDSILDVPPQSTENSSQPKQLS